MQFNKETLHELLAIIPALIAQFVMGSSYAWPAHNIKYLLSSDSDIPLTHEQSSLVVSLLHVGRFCAPILAIAMAGKLGRKFQLTFSSVCLLCSFVLTAATRSVFLLCLARFMCGYAAGIFDGVYWVYVGEVTSGRTRGFFCSSLVVFFYVGTSFQFLIGPILTYQQAAILWIWVAICLILLMFFAVETPYYLLSTGRREDALTVLSWLRAKPKKTLEPKLIDMESHMIHSAGFNEFIHLFELPIVYKSFFINLTFAVICTSVTVQLNAFATFIFPSSDILSSDHFSACFGVIQLLASFVSFGVIQNFGRKIILVATYGISAILLFAATVLIYMNEHSFEVPYYAWIIFSTVSAYMFVYGVGTIPVVCSLRAELFPTVIKELGSNLVVIVNSTVNFVLAYIFFTISYKFGMYVNFIIFFLCCVFGVLFSLYVVPETKDKSLEEIQDILDNKTKKELNI